MLPGPHIACIVNSSFIFVWSPLFKWSIKVSSTKFTISFIASISTISMNSYFLFLLISFFYHFPLIPQVPWFIVLYLGAKKNIPSHSSNSPFLASRWCSHLHSTNHIISVVFFSESAFSTPDSRVPHCTSCQILVYSQKEEKTLHSRLWNCCSQVLWFCRPPLSFLRQLRRLKYILVAHVLHHYHFPQNQRL